MASAGARRDPSGAVYYFFSDHLGSSRVVADGSGTVVDEWDYRPFGNGILVSYASGNRYLFTGQEHDPESNLYNFRARYYTVPYGRFLQPDPLLNLARTIPNPQKWNRYAYVLNNPLIMVDPNGLEELTVTFKTWIPTETVRVPIIGATLSGDRYGGYRTIQNVRIETDPAKRTDPQIGEPKQRSNETKELDSGGNVIRRAQASGETLHAGATRNADGSLTVTASGNESNPIFVSPGITYNFSLTINQDGSYVLTGTQDGFPAYGVMITREDGSSETIYYDLPNEGATPWCLFPVYCDEKVEEGGGMWEPDNPYDNNSGAEKEDR